MKNTHNRFILGISGASGVKLASGFLRVLPREFEVHIILSRGVCECAKYELGLDIKGLESMLINARNEGVRGVDSRADFGESRALDSARDLDSAPKSSQKSKAKSSKSDSGVLDSARDLDSSDLDSSALDSASAKTPRIHIWHDDEIGAPVASGSFGAEMMAIIPTSMDALAKIACGISDTLLSRAASVMIKERRTLLLAPREMPLNAIVCEQMQRLASLGVIIAPPIIAYYSYPKNLAQMEHFIYGKWLDILRIPNDLYQRWGESSEMDSGKIDSSRLDSSARQNLAKTSTKPASKPTKNKKKNPKRLANEA
ncbi:hypothetical protein BKN38_01870 [Helicobacter sp. CLO-3]|nr:hypothetical protein BA723_01180 [Helicobacter sp. CLO-3]OHU84812.1 hypothetical protein BKN38_01870 [Helicobacter sp. CLO-3]